MIILVDKRIPEPAFKALRKYGKIIPFETSGITYSAISGHPDIFFCQTNETLVVAPNTPNNIKAQLTKHGIHFLEGRNHIGKAYPFTAQYNAVITEKYLIHNPKYTDPVILSNCGQLEAIEVNQAYARCNLVALNGDGFITSDTGIEKTLQKKGLEVLYIDPKGILLPGFEHGFFGGTCGIFQDKVFFTGSLDHFPEGKKARQFLSGYEIIELYDGPLFDGGSILFIGS